MSELTAAIAAYALGMATGLWFGFKLWRQEYVKLTRRGYGGGWRR